MMTRRTIAILKVGAFVVKLPAILLGLMYATLGVMFGFLGGACPATHMPLQDLLLTLLWFPLAILFCFPNRILIRRKYLSVPYVLLTCAITIAAFTTGTTTKDFLTGWAWRHHPAWLVFLPFASAPLSLLVRLAIKREEEKTSFQPPAGGDGRPAPQP